MTHPIVGYRASYFLPTVREVFDPLLAEHGFSYAGDHRTVTAYWASGDRFFRVGYLPETKPDYELMMGLGESEESPLQPKSFSNSVGVWRVLPADVAPQIADWRFADPASLREELRRAWDEAIEPYVIPLWRDEHQLATVIADLNAEITGDVEKLMEDRLLAYARAQFEAGRFAEAIDAYDEVPEGWLTRADRKRMEIARRRM